MADAEDDGVDAFLAFARELVDELVEAHKSSQYERAAFLSELWATISEAMAKVYSNLPQKEIDRLLKDINRARQLAQDYRNLVN